MFFIFYSPAQAKPKYKLKDVVTAESVDEFTGNAINVTDQFSEENQYVFVLVYLQNIRSALNVKFEVFNPRGEFFNTLNYYIQDPPPGFIYDWSVVFYWIRTDTMGKNYGDWTVNIYLNDKKKKTINFVFNAPPLRLWFPLWYVNSPYDVEMSAVLDHSGPFNKKDGVVLAFNGEEGRREYGADCEDKYYNKRTGNFVCKGKSKRWGYKKGGNFNFSILNGKEYLFFDGSSGYEYPNTEEEGIFAPAGGTLCVATNKTVPQGGETPWRNKKVCPISKDPITKSNWNKNHTFYIIHDNIYTTWYSFPEGLSVKALSQVLKDGYAVIKEDDLLGFTGSWGLKDTFPRLYFSVRKNNGKEIIDPYGWREKNQPIMWVDDYFK